MILSKLNPNSTLVVMSEVTYNAVKTIFTMYGAFMKDVAEEIGWEKTLHIYMKSGERDGESMLRFFASQPRESMLEAIARSNIDFFGVSGWDVDYVASPSSLEYHIRVCPLFDGFHAAGLSHEQINAICGSNHKGVQETLRRVYPEAEFTSEKPSIIAPCIEKIKIPL